jgi:hypothetical protein
MKMNAQYNSVNATLRIIGLILGGVKNDCIESLYIDEHVYKSKLFVLTVKIKTSSKVEKIRLYQDFKKYCLDASWVYEVVFVIFLAYGKPIFYGRSLGVDTCKSCGAVVMWHRDIYSLCNNADETIVYSGDYCHGCAKELNRTIEAIANEEKGDGYIYGYYAKEINMIKIGKGVNPIARKSYSVSQSPVPVELYFIAKGYTKAERWMHQKFDEERRNGEWFIFSDRLREFILSKSEVFTVYQ